MDGITKQLACFQDGTWLALYRWAFFIEHWDLKLAKEKAHVLLNVGIETGSSGRKSNALPTNLFFHHCEYMEKTVTRINTSLEKYTVQISSNDHLELSSV